MEKKFAVTVEVAGNPTFKTTVQARDEWQARTRAMFSYPHKLRGQTAEYTVTEA